MKYLFGFTILSIAFGGVAFAQDTLWTKTFGHIGSSDLGLCGDVTADGGFLVSGVSVAFPGGDVWVVRADSNGDTVWTPRILGRQMATGKSN